MSILILNARVVNEGVISENDVFIRNGIIERIAPNLSHLYAPTIINAKGNYLMPGVIDDQVHFREPGLTHKACIASEARAAVAGGTTSFMEMPNTVPNIISQALLEKKYQIASRTSLANYSFFMGASNNNLDEVLRTNPKEVCGIKVFMGSSTGNMLVDNEQTLENLFSECSMLIATHCEDEATIRHNLENVYQIAPNIVGASLHPIIRNEEACWLSSSMAVSLAKKHNTRLHVLHISTAEELALFDAIPLSASKRITAEVCVHHLWFDATQYATLGNQIKCNPAIKEPRHKEALLKALLNDQLDVLATDHAPHTWQEKQQEYATAPSGLPLVQHSLQMMLEFVKEGKISIETLVRKNSHAVADCFQIDRRGYIREGYWADIVLTDVNSPQTIHKQNIMYQCGWSPLEGTTFSSTITHTIVSGNLVYAHGIFDETLKGHRLIFNR